MSRLDAFDKEDETQQSTMCRVLNVCKTYALVTDKCRDVAAFLVSRFLTRIDVKELYMSSFFTWACELSVQKDSSVFVKYGTLASVAMILKNGKREDLLPHATKLLQWIINSEFKNNPGSNVQKLVYKIIQRIGMYIEILFIQKLFCFNLYYFSLLLRFNIFASQSSNMEVQEGE